MTDDGPRFTTQRPRLLLLAFCFPPLQNVASLRPAYMAKYLSRRGWDVTVVTPDPALWRLIDDPEAAAASLAEWGVHMIYTDHRWRFLSSGHLKRAYDRGPIWLLEGLTRRIARIAGIDENTGWYSEVQLACADLKLGDVDVVLITGGPFGAFHVGQNLARRLGCPYVLDYRDLWTDNPHARDADREMRERAERPVLADSSAVIVVSPSMAQSLGDRFGVFDRVNVVTNGFDPDDLAEVEAASFEHFAIVYAGRFYPPKSTVSPLMMALTQLNKLRELDAWAFHYYGPQGDLVTSEAAAWGLEGRLVNHGMVPRTEVLAALRGAGCAVVITSVLETAEKSDLGIMTGKIFEAIGLGTKLLVIAPPDSDVDSVVREAGQGRTFVGSDASGMAAYLSSLMDSREPAAGVPAEYSWPALADKVDSVLRSAIADFQETIADEPRRFRSPAPRWR